MKHEHKNISKEMCKDSGLALVLICMICFQVWKHQFLILLAIAFLLVAMTYPPIFKPFARLWFGLSTALGTVVSRIILTIVFFTVVLPVGLMRRMLGKDAMKIKLWKKDNTSVFRRREHRFAAKDLEHPY
jgi:multisubunit Na+/H+ antiporter MnhG subunit